jgi:hypothetical protein
VAVPGGPPMSARSHAADARSPREGAGANRQGYTGAHATQLDRMLGMYPMAPQNTGASLAALLESHAQQQTVMNSVLRSFARFAFAYLSALTVHLFLPYFIACEHCAF